MVTQLGTDGCRNTTCVCVVFRNLIAYWVADLEIGGIQLLPDWHGKLPTAYYAGPCLSVRMLPGPPKQCVAAS
jgi:hypothetical protein